MSANGQLDDGMPIIVKDSKDNYVHYRCGGGRGCSCEYF